MFCDDRLRKSPRQPLLAWQERTPQQPLPLWKKRPCVDQRESCRGRSVE